MTKNKDAISRINEINRKISYHSLCQIHCREKEKAKHQRTIEKLRKEKSILMMNGEWIKNDRE